MDSQSQYFFSKLMHCAVGFTRQRAASLSTVYSYQFGSADCFNEFCNVYSISRVKCAGETILTRRNDILFDLIYMYDGMATIKNGAASTTVRSGELYLARSGSSYSVTVGAPDKADIMLLTHSGSIGERFYREILRSDGAVLRPDSAARESIFARTDDITRCLQYPYHISGLLAVSAMVRLLTTVYRLSLDPNEYNPLGQPLWFERAAEYMLSNPGSCTVEELARQSGLSQSHFHKLFLDYTGKTPHRYLLERRLADARRRLEETAEPVKSIAVSSGFSSTGAFIRSYKEQYGVTPGKFRDKTRN